MLCRSGRHVWTESCSEWLFGDMLTGMYGDRLQLSCYCNCQNQFTAGQVQTTCKRAGVTHDCLDVIVVETLLTESQITTRCCCQACHFK